MKGLLLIAISILSVGCGTQLGSDLEGLAGGLGGLAGGLISVGIIIAGIAIVIVGALGGFLGSSIGWNLTRNSKEDPDKIEPSQQTASSGSTHLGPKPSACDASIPGEGTTNPRNALVPPDETSQPSTPFASLVN